jgi:hypothetical protein
MTTPETVQLVDFPSTSSVAAGDLIYSANGTTGVEQATTMAQLQAFVQLPIASGLAVKLSRWVNPGSFRLRLPRLPTSCWVNAICKATRTCGHIPGW